ncbi:glycine cleavage system H protein-like [Gigantopelta aegis]|uniref:glycine cleavage system H protein-like n=1 Tax=Gigantopelta aegis TaxID=1735272 RepID=UPI001B88D607|nr:glycine cleavage system H protein-like [Gigantopelta aegis]
MAACILKNVSSCGFKLLLHTPRHVVKSNIRARQFCVSVKVLADRYYTDKHEWISVDGNTGRVGISDYAQDKLGEVVYVQLPEIGQELERDGECGCLESVKAASEIFTPMAGTVTEINHLVSDTPKLINDHPYSKGWLFELKLSDSSQLKELKNEDQYNEYIKSLD